MGKHEDEQISDAIALLLNAAQDAAVSPAVTAMAGIAMASAIYKVADPSMGSGEFALMCGKAFVATRTGAQDDAPPGARPLVQPRGPAN